MEITFKTNPHKAVSFIESAVKKALDKASYLIADIKYDGVRGNIVVDNTADSLWLSRVSKTIPALEHLNGFDKRWEMLLKDDRCIFPDGFMLDGELMVKGVDFNTGSGLLRTKWLKASNHEFDIGGVPPLKGSKVDFCLDPKKLKVVLYGVMSFDSMVSGETYEVMNLLMREHVKAMLPVLREHFPEIEWDISESYEVYDYVELTALYEKARADGHEGLVVKDPLGFYMRGKKSGYWKMKPECEADGVIVGLNWGTPGLANEGKVIGFEVLLESGRVVSANNISQALMDEFTDAVKHAESVGMGMPYTGFACQVAYMEETPDGSLRHPSFVMFRGVESDPTVKM
ncbi:DNA ligase [Yersinia phage PYPS50]|uniref:DNA ligase n=1 Tax=Yersinia phage PYPS50 TaxID=2321391 RepID=A0A3G8F0M8_9CAUD|nr:DNA ligase [Yersinia phage PYPS50]AZF87568.1 ATP-dependent DNA ligase [Yersinia phage PYPS50]QQM13727.1 ATP-dependent DNA ligase [Yersinia phage PYps50T]QQO91388.1 ATP-dependent DNA ligase [Yersinia phage PYps49T]